MSENIDLTIADLEEELDELYLEELENEELVETKKPQVLLDSNRYWTGQYATSGSVIGGVEADTIPEERDFIKQRAYKLLEDNTWFFDEERYNSLVSDKAKALQMRKNKRKIAELQKQLSDTDYKVIKCYEYNLAGQPMPYDVAALHEERQAIRDEINILEELI